MKIALVQMPPHPRDTPPFEMALTAALLRREGHDVTVFDVNNEMYNETFKARPNWKFQLTDHSTETHAEIFRAEGERFSAHAERILAGAPDAVVFKTENAFHNAINMARLIKARSPMTPTVASGTNNPDPEIIKMWKSQQDVPDETGRAMPFDLHILGEDDVALPEALKALAAGDVPGLAKRFTMNGRYLDARAGPHLDDLDSLPFYDFRDYDIMRYGDPVTLRFNASRSCTQHCAFCQDWVIGRKYRTMSGDRWFEEYRTQSERHPGIQHYQYYDRLLNGDIEVLERYCDRIISHYGEKTPGGGPPVIWAGDFIIRPEMTDALIKKMAQANCGRFGTGLESGSERVRRSVFKDFFTNETAATVFESCRRHGINVAANILIGLPTETREEFRESIRFVEENAANIWEIRLTAPTLLVQAGTPLANSPARFNLKDKTHEKWESIEGGNDYLERVRRFEEFCASALTLSGPRLAVNRRIIKNAAGVKKLVEECRRGVTEPV
jgi:radical SAM superfamily enzyme YgiQ (UPF0313 family)